MITLLIVGPAVEVMLGKIRFLALYLMAGLGGKRGSYLFSPANSVSAGASGAIFGVMGAYVVLAHPTAPTPWCGGRPDRDQPGHRLHRQHRLACPPRRPGGRGLLLALAYDYAGELRQPAGRILLTVGSSWPSWPHLAVLLVSIPRACQRS
jgi:hypothetical protein